MRVVRLFPTHMASLAAATMAMVVGGCASTVPLNPPQWPMGDGDYMRSRSSGSSNALGLPLPGVSGGLGTPILLSTVPSSLSLPH